MKKAVKKQKVKSTNLDKRVEQLETVIKIMTAFVSFTFILSVLK